MRGTQKSFTTGSRTVDNKTIQKEKNGEKRKKTSKHNSRQGRIIATRLTINFMVDSFQGYRRNFQRVRLINVKMQRHTA